MKGAQLALAVQLQQNPSFDTFFPGPNEALVQVLRAQDSPTTWLFGAAASGKTHLLRAAVGAAGGDACYVCASTDAQTPQRIAAITERGGLLAVDDVDTQLAQPEWSVALLRLIDQRRARGLRLLLSASTAIARLDLALADLRTRFESMLQLGLKPLRESDRRELLRLHAAARGLELPEDAVAWLLVHLQRDAGTLIAALEALDHAALTAKRRLTLPFVQQVLGERSVQSEAESLRTESPG